MTAASAHLQRQLTALLGRPACAVCRGAGKLSCRLGTTQCPACKGAPAGTLTAVGGHTPEQLADAKARSADRMANAHERAARAYAEYLSSSRVAGMHADGDPAPETFAAWCNCWERRSLVHLPPCKQALPVARPRRVSVLASRATVSL